MLWLVVVVSGHTGVVQFNSETVAGQPDDERLLGSNH